MDSKYLLHLAGADLKTTEYKIILMLLTKSYTASQLAAELGIMKQNKNRYIKRLKTMGLIQIERIEGRNVFYRAVTDIKALETIMPGQIKI